MARRSFSAVDRAVATVLALIWIGASLVLDNGATFDKQFMDE